MYLVSFVIGLIIVISSIFLIRSEFNRAVRSQTMLLEQSRVYKDVDLFELLESLQRSIDDMNRAFYDIANDLEGKYSVHEKEIQILSEKMEQIKRVLSEGVKPEKTKSSAPVPTKSTKENIEHMNNLASTAIQSQGNDQDNISTNHPGNQLGHHPGTHSSQLLDQDKLSQLKASETTLTTQIIEMRSQGKTLTQIAKELGIGMGELQLLITLKK